MADRGGKEARSAEAQVEESAKWWALSTGDACAELDADIGEGLAPEEAETRLDTYGPNRIEGRRTRGPLRRFLSQFNNLLIQILLAAAALTAFFGEWLETGVILLVVFVNALIGFVQEGRAEAALRAIQDMLSPTARVVRGGRRQRIEAAMLVPGDLVLLEAGERVPADLRILKSRGLQTQEAMLTGESAPIDKDPAAQPEDTVLADRRSMAFSGTLITSGQGSGLVVATGGRTELGRISGMLDDVTDMKTPLLRAMDTFARWLSIIIVALAGAIFAVGVWVQGNAPADMLMTAVAIAVAAIPEGLPAILTVTLAIGVQRMAARRAIIRKLPAVETLGALTVICSDKTGTLTRNELVLRHLWLADSAWTFSGTGYEPTGEVRRARGDAGEDADGKAQRSGDDAATDDSGAETEEHAAPAEETPLESDLREDPRWADLEQALFAAVLCNEASVREQGGSTKSEHEQGVAEGSPSRPAPDDGTQQADGGADKDNGADKGDDEDEDEDEDAPGWQVEGDPLEAALLVAARKASLDDEEIREAWPRVDSLPFSSERKLMATLHEAPEEADAPGRYWLVVKGAPDRLLELAADGAAGGAGDGGTEEDAGHKGDKGGSAHGNDEATGSENERSRKAPSLDAEHWQARLEERTAEGERVLGLAWRWLDEVPEDLEAAVEGLTFGGLIGFLDPPREEAIEAVADAQAAGVRVIMITGDHLGTARAIARQLGLKRTDDAMDGRAIDALDDEALRERVMEVDVYGRTTPEHKLRLVRAIRSHGGVVGMTGDGVNDAPALKQADVGIAMGKKGTETAREASEMVLTDDNFASITSAIREGRNVYDNLRKAITFLLPVNGGESASILIAILSGLALPIAPLQILWVNMVSSVALAMALAFEPAEDNVMRRPPRRTDRGILSPFLIWRIFFVSALFTVGIFGSFIWATRNGYDEATARTMAVNMLVALEIFYLLSVRVLTRPLRSLRDLMGTVQVRIAIALVLVLQALFTWAPFMNSIFGTTPIALEHLGRIFVAGLLFLGLLEFEKWVRGRFFGGNGA